MKPKCMATVSLALISFSNDKHGLKTTVLAVCTKANRLMHNLTHYLTYQYVKDNLNF
jgi:hypothetical protein